MKKSTLAANSRVRSALVGRIPQFEWEQYQKVWASHKNHKLALEEAQEDLRDRDADLKSASVRTTPLVTVSTVLLAAYGLQQSGTLAGWVPKAGIILTTIAIITVLLSHMPSWKVWHTKFQDAGWWVLKTNNDYDRFVKIVYKTHLRNHALTRVRRLQTISFSLVIISVIMTAAAFLAR
jgi:hypothetical protein